MASHWVLVTHDYPPMKGGVARYLSDLVQASKGGMRVLVPNEHGDLAEPVERTVFFQTRGMAWWPLVRVMRDLGKDSETQVLVSHVLPIGTAAWIASFFGGPRYTVLLHGLDLRLSQRSLWKRWVTKRILKRAGHICVNSKFVENECRSLFPWSEPIVLTPGYAVRTLPSKAMARESLGILPEECILLQTGRLVARKGVDRLIEALPYLPPHVRAVCIGEGVDRERLEAMARPLGDRILFLGAVSDEVRDLWYAAADIFVFPVRPEGDDVEGYGMVCLEASAAGMPVVVGKNGGAPETVVEGETGYVIDANKRDELVLAIQRLVADPTLRQRMGEQGRARVLREGDWGKRWEILSHL